MDEQEYAWAHAHECFGATVVEGAAAAEAVAALSGGTAVEVSTRRQGGENAVVGALVIGDRLLLWEPYPWIGLDPQVPRLLSAAGRCVSLAYGMTQSMMTVAERGEAVREFDPVLRGPVDQDTPWYDEDDDPEADRLGDPLSLEDEVDWTQERAASLRFVELVSGVAVADEVWDDPRVRWYVYEPLPYEEMPVPPLVAVLSAAAPQERHARLRAGLVCAATILGLQDHPPFVRLLADADEQRAVVGAARGGASFNRAMDRLREWEFPLGQRVEPLLYPVPGENWPPPPRAKRYRPTGEEKAELRLAMACSEFLCGAGLDGFDGITALAQLEQAVGDRFPEVEAAMLAEPAHRA